MTEITFSEKESAVLNEALNLVIGFLSQVIDNDNPAQFDEELVKQTRIRIGLFDALRVKIRRALYKGPEVASRR